MKVLRENKGFTLIELAIVLVIIGIILGAVLKGQDLIQNARAKKFINWSKQWEVAQWTYFDRKGRFAGDSGKNGVIGDETAEQTAAASAVGEILNANFVNAPTETISLGSYTFYMRMGYDAVSGTNKNVIVICKNTACDSAFSTDELVYLEAIDTAIDGSADDGDGNVRGASAVTLASGSGNRVVTAVTEITTSGDWDTGDVALVYYFDRPY